MKRGGALKRRTPLRSKPGPGIKLDVLQALWRRSQGRCEVVGCGSRAEHPHHKRRRSQFGGDDLSNLMAICSIHHRMIHDQVGWALAQGYLIDTEHAR